MTMSILLIMLLRCEYSALCNCPDVSWVTVHMIVILKESSRRQFRAHGRQRKDLKT
jgi:hypothetical protein